MPQNKFAVTLSLRKSGQHGHCLLSPFTLVSFCQFTTLMCSMLQHPQSVITTYSM